MSGATSNQATAPRAEGRGFDREALAARLRSLSASKRALFEAELARRGIDVASLVIPLREQPCEAYPLSFAQQRLWFIHQVNPESSSYHIATPRRVRGTRLDLAALRRAARAMVERHETLRTTFRLGAEGRPEQVVHPVGRQPVPVVDFAGLDGAARVRAARRLATREALTAFDLGSGPLWRITVARLAGDDHLLLLTMHHIVSDGWSLGILFRELLALYAAHAGGAVEAASVSLPPLPVQYVDYALWQREWLAGAELERQLAYWRGQLAEAPPLLNLPIDRPRPPLQRAEGDAIALRLAPELVAGLRALARSARTTLFVTLLAAYKVALARLAGTADVVVGAPVAGRTRREIEGLIGFFINTLVLRSDLSGDPPFDSLLGRVHAVNEGANVHQDLPFEKLVEELAPERDLRHSPLFQASFAFQAEPGGGTAMARVEITALPIQRGVSIFELAVSLLERREEVVGGITFKTDLFDRTTVQRLRALYLRILEAAVARPGAPLSALSALSPPERQQLTVEWNHQPADPAPAVTTLHGLFEARARRHPRTVALTFEASTSEGSTPGTRESWSYGELHARAARIAGHLRARGAGPETLVAVALDRSPEQVAALLGVLMSGAAYLPLDPEAPAERLTFMLRDAEPGWLLAESARLTGSWLPALAELKVEGMAIEELRSSEEAALGAPDDPDFESAHADPRHPAYVIYTSGSTGRPKGVVITHGSIVGRLEWARRHDVGGDRDAESRPFGYLNKTALSFDVSVLEIFLPLTVGGRVVLTKPGGQWDVPYLLELIHRERLTHASFPPSMHAVLLEQPRLAEACRELEVLYTAGEAIPAAMAREIVGRLGVALDNRYGPTEATIGMLSWRCRAGDASAAGAGLPVPIGRPITDAVVYLADREQRPVPLGAGGELLIGGGCLARGYLRRPALTAERFVPDWLSGGPGARLYRTGDLARHRADGAIEFLGRVDHQVKVRGFRVELGEIEAAMAAHPAAGVAAVIDRREASGTIELVGYWSPREGAVLPAAAEARAYLAERLPDYMVPAYLVALEALPRTASGKVDRRALASDRLAAGARAAAGQAEAIAPRDEVERRVAAIWCELLGVDGVGVEQNFFDLGGHSLLLVRVHARLAEAFPERPPSMLDLFRFTTVAALAELVGGGAARAAGAAAAEPGAALSARQVRTGAARAARRAGTLPGKGVAPGSRDVAIIGMAARFPGAATIEDFWRNLRDGVESIERFTMDELLAAGVPRSLAENPAYVPAVSRVKGIELFDAPLFGMSPREAQMTDPQQRLLLECAWEVLERAGYDPELVRAREEGGAIGVYAGVGFSRYWVGAYATPGLLESVGRLQVTLSNDKDFAPTRISYKLNLHGPSVNVNTACSTSLVTAHLACQGLLAGECDMAISGGASISPWQATGYLYSEGGIASPDGRCRAFDARAGGAIGGNGAGVVLLKRLADALADGDTIHAVIKGSAINNDGSAKIGFTAPSVEGQTAVIAEAQAVAGVASRSIGYVEAHGTGTVLGDPIEIAALRAVFEGDEAGSENSSAIVGENGAPPAKRVAIGSVKTNLGHLSAAAGVAGLVKAALAVEQGEIPPSLHFESPNPRTELESSPFYVNTTLTPWSPPDAAPRRAGVSAFGLGGTNAHLVLEQAPPRAPSGPSRGRQLLLLSARTPSALEAASARLAAHLEAHPEQELADVAHTLAVGRRQLACRRIVVCATRDEAIAALAPSVEGGVEGDGPRALSARLDGAAGAPSHRPAAGGEGNGSAAEGAGAQAEAVVPRSGLRQAGVAFLLPGLGDHHAGMGRELYEGEALFRREVDRCCGLLEPHLGLDLRTLLYPDDAGGEERPGGGGVDLRAMLGRSGNGEETKAAASADGAPSLDRTRWAQPAVFVIEYALARLWASWGVEPEALIGYSLGEYTAACLAGVLSLEEALALVAARAELIDSLPAGVMLAVPLAEQELVALLPDGASLAAVNGPAACVASGPEAAIARLETALAARELVSRRVRTTHAFHSAMMRPIVDRFRQALAAVTLRAPRVPYLSNVTGSWVTDDEARDPELWVRHLCEPVRFSAGMERLTAEPGRVLLEVGPGRTLSTLTLQARARSVAEVEDASRAEASSQAEAGKDPGEAAPRELLLASLPGLWQAGAELEHLLTTLGRLWLAGVPIDRPALFAHERRRRVILPTYPFERQRYWLEAPQFGGAPARKRGGRALRNPDLRSWFHVPAWRRSQPPSPARAVEGEGCWWLFTDRLGVGDRLAERLRAEGLRVELIPAAEAADPGVYDRLVTTAATRPPAGVVHLWCLDAPVGEASLAWPERFAAAQEAGLHSLLGLGQALARAGFAEPLAWTVATRGAFDVDGHQPLRPETATARGALLVLPQEYRNLTCRQVDLAFGAGAEGPSSAELDRAAAQLHAEATALSVGSPPAGPLSAEPPSAEPQIAYRGAGRWVRRFDPIRLDPVPLDPAALAPAALGSGALDPAPRSGLRQGGVYLLVGGLGRVGLVMARFLAERASAKLILVGRSALPPRESWARIVAEAGAGDGTADRLRALLEIEGLGGEIYPLVLDAGDPERLTAGLKVACEHFGAGAHGDLAAEGPRIDGVFHLAGLTERSVVQVGAESTTPEVTDRHFAAKARVLHALEEALGRVLGERCPDFCLLFSSIAAELGGLGFAAYAAANAYLDAFAESRRLAGANLPWTSVGWDGWAWLPPGETPKGLAMTPAESCDAFERILTLAETPRLVVSTGDLEARLDRWVRFAADAAPAGAAGATAGVAESGSEAMAPEGSAALFERPQLTTDYQAPKGESEARVAALWGELLGVERVGRRDNFFELGGDSLLATQLVSRLRRSFRVEMPLPVFFAAPTVAGLAAAVEEKRYRQEELSEVEKALAKIKGLSAEQVAAQLAERAALAPDGASDGEAG